MNIRKELEWIICNRCFEKNKPKGNMCRGTPGVDFCYYRKQIVQAILDKLPELGFIEKKKMIKGIIINYQVLRDFGYVRLEDIEMDKKKVENEIWRVVSERLTPAKQQRLAEVIVNERPIKVKGGK